MRAEVHPSRKQGEAMPPDQLFKHTKNLKGFKMSDDTQWSGLYPSLHNKQDPKRRHLEHGLDWLLDWLPAGWEIHCDRTPEDMYTNIDLVHESPGRKYKMALERLLDEFAHKVHSIMQSDKGYLKRANGNGKFPNSLGRMANYIRGDAVKWQQFATGARNTSIDSPVTTITLPKSINPAFYLAHRFLKSEVAIQFGEDWIVSAHVYFGWEEDFSGSRGPYKPYRHDWLVVRGIREGWNSTIHAAHLFQKGVEQWQGFSSHATPGKATEAASHDYLITPVWKQQYLGASPLHILADEKFLMDHGTELGGGGYDTKALAKEDAATLTANATRILKLPLDASLFGTAKWFVKAHEMVVEGTKNSNPHPGDKPPVEPPKPIDVREHKPLHGPYTFNDLGVCIDATLAFHYNNPKRVEATITVACNGGKWCCGHSIQIWGGNFEGVYTPCSFSRGEGFDTPEEALHRGFGRLQALDHLMKHVPEEAYAYLLPPVSPLPFLT